jgi:transcription antitermination factor NusG
MSAAFETSPQIHSEDSTLQKCMTQQAAGGGWQLVYTVARHEKAVSAQLRARGVDCYLPLSTVIHRWKERRATVDIPLFPAYVFFRLTTSNRREVVMTPGVVQIVSFQGAPAVVPDDQVRAVQLALQHRNTCPCPYLAGGRRVQIMSGPLQGIIGVIDRIKETRVIVSVEAITSSIAIEVQAADLELCSEYFAS